MDIPTVPTIGVLMGLILTLTLIGQSLKKRLNKTIEFAPMHKE
jgi:hypothetical protein